jgi:uncharacterized protein
LSKLNIAVIGSGISGLSCAWALSQKHHVTLIESDDRLGGHSNTVDVPLANGKTVAVDTGFIVHNPATYPNFVALLDYLDVGHEETKMTFAVSIAAGRFEYSGQDIWHLLGRARQWASPSHWRMIYDLVRFYKTAAFADVDDSLTLRQFLQQAGYSHNFVNSHILPIAAAIWSSSPAAMADYPFKAFVRFFSNHNLFMLGDRPNWRTVAGGSQAYVQRLVADGRFVVRTGLAVKSITRQPGGVTVLGAKGISETYDHVVLATHADQALRLLAQPSLAELALLQHFKTNVNRAVLHRDTAFMPKAKRFWSSWNYMGAKDGATSVTYWMNALQNLRSTEQHFVSLNPIGDPSPEKLDGTFIYRHPLFTTQTLQAQKQLWSLQGVQNTWFCGAWFGSGFHEDGLQAGLAVAEQLGGVRRPWAVPHESNRIHLSKPQPDLPSIMVQAAE